MPPVEDFEIAVGIAATVGCDEVDCFVMLDGRAAAAGIGGKGMNGIPSIMFPRSVGK